MYINDTVDNERSGVQVQRMVELDFMVELDLTAKIEYVDIGSQ